MDTTIHTNQARTRELDILILKKASNEGTVAKS